jgi:hypothetical protein
MDHDLYYAASGKIVRSDAELIEMVGRWVTYDCGDSGGIRLIRSGDQSSPCDKKQVVVSAV